MPKTDGFIRSSIPPWFYSAEIKQRTTLIIVATDLNAQCVISATDFAT